MAGWRVSKGESKDIPWKWLNDFLGANVMANVLFRGVLSGGKNPCHVIQVVWCLLVSKPPVKSTYLMI